MSNSAVVKLGVYLVVGSFHSGKVCYNDVKHGVYCLKNVIMLSKGDKIILEEFENYNIRNQVTIKYKGVRYYIQGISQCITDKDYFQYLHPNEEEEEII